MARPTKVDLVYNHLLNEIAATHYQSGDKLVISKIAKECGVSDIPVREALQRLQSNGYVHIVPNQGSMVVGINKATIVNIIQIKGVLEGFATRLSVNYLSMHDLQVLRDINAELQKATEEGNFPLASELNQKFHMTIYEHLPQEELLSMIDDLWKKWSFTKNIFSVSETVRNQSCEEHEQILKLISLRAYDEVEQTVRKHKLKAIASWLETVDDDGANACALYAES